MKRFLPIVKLCVLSMLFQFNIHAQEAKVDYWTEFNGHINKEDLRIKPEVFSIKELDINKLKAILPQQRKDINDRSTVNTVVLGLPTPDGKTLLFRVQKSEVITEEMEREFPNIRTYRGQGITDPASSVVLDITDMGFHAMVLNSAEGSMFIDPSVNGNQKLYTIYYKKDLKNTKKFIEEHLSEASLPEVVNAEKPAPVQGQNQPQSFTPVNCSGKQILKYRIAIACTGEYAQAATGVTSPTVAQTLSCIVTTLARVTGIYEIEFSITFTLIANNSTIVFTNPNTDPFNGNNNGNTLINESQTQITQRIGSANFDIGHTFSTGGGGLAGLGVVCTNSRKASGITGSPQPTGDGYDVDYVAHEVGHQFGGEHTFNNNVNGSCGGNYSSTANCEPGSGSTIMAYAGICNDNANTSVDLQPHSDPYFVGISFNQIRAYTVTGAGKNCPVKTNSTNNFPVVADLPDFTIPTKTPFMLLGSATDPDGDTLSYCWEQVDVGGPSGDWNSPTGNAPAYRSFNPVKVPFRIFPKISSILRNRDSIGEFMPGYTRTMNFRLTVRDNRSGNGGSCYTQMKVTTQQSTAFTVSYPLSGTVWKAGTQDSVKWVVGNTTQSPFNCSKVAIELSQDGGYTYPIVVVDSTPNSGVAYITVPRIVSNSVRVRVRALNNIFFNISRPNFRIIANPAPLKLQLFTGYHQENKNQLNWSTIMESGTDFFNIERSIDGKNFETIGRVKASSFSNSLISYQFTDDKLKADVYYYRLKMVDQTGEFTYSNIIRIATDNTKFTWNVYPNPATKLITIAHPSFESKAQILIFNAAGQLVHSSTTKGTVVDEINVSNLAKGFYSIKLVVNEKTYSTSFVKQ